MSHEETRTIREFIEYPDHAKRTESAEFRANKRRLVRQLDVPCWICGSKESREVAITKAVQHVKAQDKRLKK